MIEEIRSEILTKLSINGFAIDETEDPDVFNIYARGGDPTTNFKIRELEDGFKVLTSTGRFRGKTKKK